MSYVIHCPECGKALRITDDLLGHKVKCSECKTAFTARAEADEPARRPRDEDEGPPRRRRPRYEDDEDDDYGRGREGYDEEDDYDRPRPRRGGRAEAEAAVFGPALALMIVAGVALAISLVSLALNLAGVGMAADRAQGVRQQDAVARAIGGVGGAALGVIWGAVVLSAAYQMKSLRGYGYAMTGAIVAMLPCNLCCVLGLPFGIWALMAMSREEVKRAFR